MSDEKWGTPEWHRAHPIFYKAEDLKKPASELLTKLRGDLVFIRGKLEDLSHAFPMVRTEAASGALTCIITYLYGQLKDLRTAEEEVKP